MDALIDTMSRFWRFTAVAKISSLRKPTLAVFTPVRKVRPETSKAAMMCLWAAVAGSSVSYRVSVAVFDGEPVLAYRDINGKRDNMSSAFQQVFNPSWIVASEGVHHAGLLVRTQNCSAAPGQCVRCSGSGQRASVLTFSRLASLDGAHDHPVFFPVDESSVVFAPHDETDDYGTEDPRVAYDAESGTYIMYYTCYNSGKTTQPTVTMCAAPPNTALAARDCLRTLLPLPLADAPLPLAHPTLARNPPAR
jgi:predicted GH43/DUF377 family glycosyl hydrolase